MQMTKKQQQNNKNQNTKKHLCDLPMPFKMQMTKKKQKPNKDNLCDQPVPSTAQAFSSLAVAAESRRTSIGQAEDVNNY